MEHQTTLLITLALGFVAAFAFGFLATRLRLAPQSRIDPKTNEITGRTTA